MKTLLWLDDYRNPFDSDWLVFSPIRHPFQTYWVDSYDGFVDWIEEHGIPDAICFDHDLGTVKTGYDAAKWMCDYCYFHSVPIPLYAIQSANPVGRENIQNYIENFRKHVIL